MVIYGEQKTNPLQKGNKHKVTFRLMPSVYQLNCENVDIL